MTEENLDCFKIPDTSRRDCDIMSAYMISAGGGSAYGGKWRPSPNKPEDQRLWGKPGEIKRTVTSWGEVFLTKIGQDGRAVMERHLSDHKKPWLHTDPHDHIILWNEETGAPMFQKQINYPNEVPEFKKYKGAVTMDGIIGETIIASPDANLNFASASEFKNALSRGAEIEFEWKGVEYSLTPVDGRCFSIAVALQQETEKLYDTADGVLEYMLGGDKLRDVVTKVNVIGRTL